MKKLFLGMALFLANCALPETETLTKQIEAQIQDDVTEATPASYIVHSAVQNDTGRVNYFTYVKSLTDATKLDYKNSLEVPGRARLYAQFTTDGTDFLAIGDGEDVSITRYEVSEDGKWTKGESISLQQYGVTSMGAQAVYFANETKAYYKDGAQLQIIVFNPKEMKITGTIELPASLQKDGLRTGLSNWAGREGEAFFAVGWTGALYDTVAPGSALVRIDTETDKITVTTDERCRGLNKTAVLDDKLYFFSDVINAFGYAVYGAGDKGQADCILRISPGNTRFDSDYTATLANALGANEEATVVTLTSDGKLWAQVVDTTVAPTTPGATYSEWYADGWTWKTFDLETLGNPEAVPGDPGAYGGFMFAAEEGRILSQTAADYSEATLYDVSGKKPVAGLSLPGFMLDLAIVQ